jgi:hypothetical protein
LLNVQSVDIDALSPYFLLAWFNSISSLNQTWQIVSCRFVYCRVSLDQSS